MCVARHVGWTGGEGQRLVHDAQMQCGEHECANTVVHWCGDCLSRRRNSERAGIAVTDGMDSCRWPSAQASRALVPIAFPVALDCTS